MAGNNYATPFAQGLKTVDKISSLTVIGHSYTAGTTQSDSGASNMYLEGMIPKLQSLLKVHENNVKHLGQAGERITGTQNVLTNSWFSGWSGVFQFVLPFNNANVDAQSDVVISNPVVSNGGAGIIVHGCNDVGAMFNTGISSQSAVVNRNAVQNAYRAIISRMRSGAVYGATVSAGSIAWDSSIAFTGTWSDNASVQQNTGPAYKSTATNGDKVTITIPNNFTGGTVAVNLIGQPNGVTYLTATYAASGAVTVTVNSAANFPTSGTLVIKNVRTGEEMLVTAGLNTTSWTVTAGNRGVNGTAAAAGAINDQIYVAQDTHNVTWSTNGSNATITGTTYVGGQGTANVPCGVTKRFVCTSADAGKTIIATVANIITGDTSATVQFDSWQIESDTPSPIVLTNLHDFQYGGTAFPTQIYVSAFNTAVASVVAEFDNYVKIADVYTPFYNRNGFTSTSLPASGDSGTSTATTATTLTDSSKGWATNALVGQTVTSGAVTLTVTSNTATVITGSGGWSGATPAPGSYTVTGTAASVGWTANSSTFTPTVGMIMTFGTNVGEAVLVTAVSGTSPNLTLGITRGANSTSQTAHSTNTWLGSADWMFTDNVHPNPRGHAVYAQTLYSALKTMAQPNTYQISETGGNWSQTSQIFDMGIIDSAWKTPPMTGALSAAVISQSRQTAFPMYISRPCVVVGMSVIPNASSSAVVRYGIYLPDASHSRPGRLLIDFGAYTYTATTNFSTTGLYQVLTPGWYWFSCVQQTTAVSVKVFPTNGLSWPNIMSTSQPSGTTPNVMGYAQTSITGSLADWATYTECAGVAATTGVTFMSIQLRSKRYA